MNFPILSAVTFLPLIGSIFILLIKDSSDKSINNAKYVAIFTSFVNFLLSIFLWLSFDTSTADFQFIENKQWVRGYFNFKFGVDGISILFILLTTFITPLCILSVINSIKERIKEFLIALLVMETLMIGVFCSLDLVIFYLFFEGGLIPMFLIIGIWGGPRRVYSAFKFFLFTLLGSVLLLIAVISIYWITGTTDMIQLLLWTNIPKEYQYLLWLAFFSSFAVKLPMWPVHTWLPDAHVEAPTAGSVILAAILLKMAGYGFIRFSIGLFPVASDFFTPLIFLLSIIAIVYTSLVALMQEDMKKLIAYSSVAHMGFVTVGIFTLTKQGLEGSIIQMISHGLISAALFLCVGVVYDRVHSRMISSYGGLVHIVPKYAVIFMIFTLAALGLPGTSGFVGEILILIGAFQKNILVAVLVSSGVIFAAAYMLWLYKRVIFGKINNNELKKICDLNKTEIFILSSLAFLTLFFGFYPEPLLRTVDISVSELIRNYEMDLTFYLKEAAK
jgi:NADH-quinone oxidoreductase subunit M